MLIKTVTHLLQRFVPLKFVLVGGTGFLIDYALLMLFISVFEWMPWVARLASLLITSILIWPFHRQFAFAKSRDGAGPELVRYYMIVIGAAIVNYVIFVSASTLWTTHALWALWPLIIPMIIAAFVAMLFSYFGFKYFVFRPDQPL